MCGFAGIARSGPGVVSPALVDRMGRALRHRGPDSSGRFTDTRVGLAHERLSLIDAAGGAQPMASASGDVVLVYNGEIFNHLKLKGQLEARGHVFRTRSDTEVLLQAWLRWGEGMLDRLNGQFAFAIYDRRDRSVFLARDRFGVLPLFFAERRGDLYFGSEIKALLAGGVPAEVSPQGLDQVFTFWAARAPRTPFRDIYSLEPGACAQWRDGRLAIRKWYTPAFPGAEREPDDIMDRLDDTLRSAVGLRLIADVPVGGYLSGGIDSSALCALASEGSSDLNTFSVTFDDPRFDESAYQLMAARRAGSRHTVLRIGDGDIARVFPDVIRQVETPLLRTAPAPLYLLSQCVREHGVKTVLSGEGADEIFWGYSLFKDTAVRLFCLRHPESRMRPRLFDRLYPEHAPMQRHGDFWSGYFLSSGSPSDPLFSHLPRFRTTAWIKQFYTDEFRASLGDYDPLAELRDELPPAFAGWSPQARAAYLEVVTFLSPYLLAAQGDRVAMAHGIEARVPYLDHRVFELAAALPDSSKLRGLSDKRVMRRWAERVLPPDLARRPKQPYRAPDVPAFFGPRSPEYVDDLLDAGSLRRTGIFNPAAVSGLVRRCRSGLATGTRESQALVAIMSTQLWHEEFIGARSPKAVPRPALAASA